MIRQPGHVSNVPRTEDLGVLQGDQGRVHVHRGGDPGSVDPIQQVEADVGIPGDGQGVVEQRLRLRPATAVELELGPPLQGQRLADGAAEVVAEPGGRPQVRVSLVEVARQQPGLAPQRHRVGPAPGRADPVGLGLERIGEGDDVGVRRRPVEQPLADAEVPVEDADRQLRHRGRVEQVGPDPAPQVPVGVGGGGLGPGGDHQRRVVTGRHRQPPALRRLGCPQVGRGEAEHGRAGPGQRLGQLSRRCGRGDVTQGLHATGRVALLDLRQRLHGPDVVGFGPPDHLGGQGVGRGRAEVTERLQDLGPQAQRIGPAGVVGQHRVQVAQSLAEGAHPDCPPGRIEQPAGGLVGPVTVEPVAGDQGGLGAGGGQTSGGVAVHDDPLVGRDLRRQGSAHQVVPEPVPGTRDDEHARGESRVQQGEPVGLVETGEGQHAGRVEVAVDDRQPAQHRHTGTVQPHEPGLDRIPH